MSESNLCKNCNSELLGIYCSECGQKNTELLSVKAIVKELTDNVFSFDSRFFITLKYLIIKPGFLTKEWFFYTIPQFNIHSKDMEVKSGWSHLPIVDWEYGLRINKKAPQMQGFT